jgi:hypothetical protein
VLLSTGDLDLINYHEKYKSRSCTLPQHLSIADNNQTVPTDVVQRCLFLRELLEPLIWDRHASRIVDTKLPNYYLPLNKIPKRANILVKIFFLAFDTFNRERK